MEIHPYVAAAVRAERENVQYAAPKTANTTLFKSAAALGGWVGADELDDHYATETLLDAAILRGVPEREARSHIQNGLNRGRANPRTLPDSQAGRQKVEIQHQPPRIRPPSDPQPDHRKIEETAAHAPEVNDAWVAARSPVDVRALMKDETGRYQAFLNHLYSPEDRVLIQTTYKVVCEYLYTQGRLYRITDVPNQYAKKNCDSFPEPGYNGLFFAFNPVTGQWVRNGEDHQGRAKYSRRCFKSIADWRYMLMESDCVPKEDWLRIISQFELPIAAIIDSGGKSLHTLIRVDASGQLEWQATGRTLIENFCHLGADPAPLKNAIEFSRLPGAWRKSKGQRQRLLYLNPAPTCSAIVGMPLLQR